MLYVHRSAGGYIKVGKTGADSSVGRLKSHATGHPFALDVLHEFPAAGGVEEREIHALLRVAGAQAKLVGEWFDVEHVATRAFLTGCAHEDGLSRGLHMLRTHVRYLDDGEPDGPWTYHQDLRCDVPLVLHGLKRRCTSCMRDLPLTRANWGTAILYDTQAGTYRNQPQCAICRAPNGRSPDHRQPELDL